jgi:hypothetical protein
VKHWHGAASKIRPEATVMQADYKRCQRNDAVSPVLAPQRGFLLRAQAADYLILETHFS